MAQRLEAALRRPGAPAQPMSAPDLAPGAPAAERDFSGNAGPNSSTANASSAKSKSVLDSLEEEMASLLGRPPEKQ